MNEKIDNNFVFVLGREQIIALEELKSVLSDFCFSRHSACDIYRITGNLVFAKLTNFDNKEAVELINRLGGTIKIYKIEGGVDKDIASQLASLLRTYKTGSEGKINFGISYYGKGFSRQNINSIALTAKKQLKGDFSLRYVESRDSADLSSILTLKNNLLTKGIEFGIFEDCIGILAAFSNPEEWNERDYGKPASDKYSGMIPPKLARMMVNLASKEIKEKNILILDPFCGSGNILLEAMVLGYEVIGNDVSEKAVKDTGQNIDWLASEYQLPNIKHQIFQADASEYDFSQLVTDSKQLAIITEPYLGEPKKFKSSHSAAAGEYAKVKELYINFFKNIKRLGSGLVICIIFPLVETVEGKRFSVFLETVDELCKLGYTQIRQPLIYGRDYQVVKREIVLLKLN